MFAQRVEAIDLVPGKKVERHAAGSHGHEVAVEGAGVVEVVGEAGIEDAHDLLAPAEGADREAAADDLAHSSQVGADAEDLLEATRAEPEGYYLVADEERPVLVGQAPCRREILRRPGEDPRPRHRLEDYRCDALSFLLHCGLEPRDIVVVNHAHQRGHPFWGCRSAFG